MSTYVDSNGRSVLLDRELGKGGEGSVYAVSGRADLVVKIYKSPPSPQTAEKLTMMVSRAKANVRLLEVAAWPHDLVYDATVGRLAGFAMPRIDGCKPIQQLYNPRQRLQSFPQASWSFQIRAARNLAAAFDEIHKAGCLVGDVNGSNIQVSNQALVRLVDCDSFQLQSDGKIFLCEVGVQHYTPPEIQGRSLVGFVRTENHDRFGLAVLIYQLLFVGRHPYQGLYQGPDDPSFEKLIKEFRFAQGPAAHQWSMAPPPHVPTFVDIPPALGILFRQAFEKGSENSNRPRPKKWLTELEQLENSLTRCAQDSGHLFWRNAGDCTWCRLARNGGPEYYYGTGDTTRGFVVNERKLQEVERRLAQIEQVMSVPNRNDYLPKFPIAVRELSPRLKQLLQELDARTKQLKETEQENPEHERKDQDAARAKLGEFEDSLKREFGPRIQRLDAEVSVAVTEVTVERRRREIWVALLLGPTFIGCCIIPFSIFHWVFALIGGSIVAGFGVWFSLFYYRATRSPGEIRVANAIRMSNQVKAEFVNRRQAAVNQINIWFSQRISPRRLALTSLRESLEEIESHLNQELQREIMQLRQLKQSADYRAQILESQWRGIVETHLRDQHNYVVRIKELATQNRSLGHQFDSESKRVTASAEAAARTRHLRLYSINDADIAGIGFGRKQILAAHQVNTAADIDEDRIRRIDGFGEKLTGKLMEWKAEVLKDFRFFGASMTGSTELQVIVGKYRDVQKQIHAEMAAKLETLELLASKCQAATNAIVSEFRRALQDFEQAKVAESQLLSVFTNRQVR
jgi:DNA-binding helix-hairpin-helix protein with protein kinase domain